MIRLRNRRKTGRLAPGFSDSSTPKTNFERLRRWKHGGASREERNELLKIDPAF
jgi:hypothetical protein